MIVMGENVIDIDTRRVQRPPSLRKQARLEALRSAEAKFEDEDGVVQAAAGVSTGDLLHIQVVELAREVAGLKFDRLHATDPRSKERLSSRRIRALTALAMAVTEAHRHAAGAPSPALVGRLIGCLRNEVEEAIIDLFPAQAAAVINALGAKLDERLDAVVADAFEARR